MILLRLFGHVEAGCESGRILGFPSWNQYLHTHLINGNCDVQINSLRDVWGVAAAIFEILLRLGAGVAVFFIMWGAFSVMMSQGEPDRVRQGKGTIVNAIIGLIVTLLAATVVSVIAGRLA